MTNSISSNGIFGPSLRFSNSRKWPVSVNLKLAKLPLLGFIAFGKIVNMAVYLSYLAPRRQYLLVKWLHRQCVTMSGLVKCHMYSAPLLPFCHDG
jgi:hypothetical protein